uniref:RAP domain-containing protein n=1 Tax=Timema poppense TaxID=170557 RepID=A0A7R9H0K3_TIMPO|nr:unnamed protein product [Timema poppensis]
MNTPEFAKLCRKLKSQARTFNINETVDALKIISYMGVHSSSIIVQTLLQLIRHQVNDLSLQQIVFLEFVLKRMKSSSLTDALRIALPLVFEAQLETKIDRSNPSQLAELLYYSVQTRCSDSCIEFLLGALNDLHHELDINSAKNVGHVSIDLLDYLCERVVENGTLLENCRPATLISVISALAIANYKPENWGCIKDSILKNPLLQDEKLELPWIKISVNLALLDCFFNPLLERVFQEDFLKKFLDRKYNLLDHLQLLTLYHAVFTLHPTYSGPLPPSAIMQEAMSKNGEHVKDFPLKGALERGLGGSCYLLTKVHTKLGQFVDHVVVMRKGGYPVAINEHSEQSTSSRQFVEDLIIPPNSQVVMIMCHLPNCYTNNCHRLRGHFVLVGKTLEALGYVVVHISLELWEKLLDHEKIPYLMQNIKLSSDSQNSSEIYA